MNVKVRFTQEISDFVGIDLKTYGPFKPDDVAEIPLENAVPLVAGKLAIVSKDWIKEKILELGSKEKFVEWLKSEYDKVEMKDKPSFDDFVVPATINNAERELKLEKKKEKALKELWKKGEIPHEEFDEKFGDVYELLINQGYIEVQQKVRLTNQAKLEAIRKIPLLKDFDFAEIPKDKFEWFGYTYRFDENNFFELVHLKPYDTYVFVDWKNKIVFEIVKIVQKNRREIVKEKPKLIEEITKILNNFTEIDNFDFNFNYEKLFNKIVKYFKSQVYLLNEEDYLIETAFTILTWISETLKIAPFLRFYAPKGSGKTTNLEAINRLAFRSLLSVSPTFAVLPRLAHYHNAFLAIDEARVRSDDLEREESVWDIIRNRNRRGAYYPKADSSNKFGVIGLEVFGLTVISGKKPIPDDVEDRCYRIEMQKKIGFKPKKVSKKEIDELVSELSKFRIWIILNNKIEELRSKIEQTIETLVNSGFESRFADIMAPILFLIPKKYHEKIIPYIREKQIWRFEEDKTTEEAYVFQAIYELLKERIGEDLTLENFNKDVEISIQEIAQKYALITNTEFDALSERDRRRLGTRTGLLIKKLGFKTKPKRDGTYAIISYKTFRELSSRYVVEDYQIAEDISLPSIDEFISNGEWCESCESFSQKIEGGISSNFEATSPETQKFDDSGGYISEEKDSHHSQDSHLSKDSR